MHQLIITRILKRGVVTLSELEARATERGLSLSELYAALEHVHKDNRIQQTVNSKGEVTYKPATAKATPSTSHLTWVRHNYPPMDNTNDGSGLEADYSYLFLSPAEMKEYKEAQRGGVYNRSNGRRS